MAAVTTYHRTKRHPPAVRSPEPEYDLQVVQNAVRSATAIGRWDVAQQIVEEAGSDICLVCTTHLAEVTTEIEDGGGCWVEIQVCSNCLLSAQEEF